MSTDYRPIDNIRMDDLFDGRLKAYGIREIPIDEWTTPEQRCLEDVEDNRLWCYGREKVEFTRFGLFNRVGGILDAIAEVFDTEMLSEYQPAYWGFNSWEEMEAWESAH